MLTNISAKGYVIYRVVVVDFYTVRQGILV